MQTVLITLGVLGFGAVVISAYVFTVAARNYVSDKRDLADVGDTVHVGEKLYVVRSSADRRKTEAKVFPLELVSGEVIHLDRRRDTDRRLVG
ncbi:hypothetical protein EYC98_10360 [Halieaceae bacterium IMCC14734]|uniref:DUF3592 domain-containing protein n=1 Tax=Candidatus Litorirhabdus singularis TaxID=2518993 RepID=A0ABT3TG35_9GAMM|nr:hypothetical protein [Candidatus Litorirhabdus singularis]MCX2981265.1 hypothetical protein [Candidatus Litorirhabdus singularis]